MTPREQAKLQTYSGISVALVAVLTHKFQPAAQWVVDRLPHGVSYDIAFFSALGIGVALLLSTRLNWKCTSCRTFLGPVNGTHCPQCGKVIDDGEGAPASSDVAEVQNQPPPPPIDPGKADEFNRALHSMLRAGRYSSWRWVMPVAIALGLFAGATSLIIGFDKREPWEFAGLFFAVGAFFGWLLLTKGVGMVQNALSLKVRCPACSKQLVNSLNEFCPFCGVALPYDKELLDAE